MPARATMRENLQQNPPPLAGEGRVGALADPAAAQFADADGIPHPDPPPQAGEGMAAVNDRPFSREIEDARSMRPRYPTIAVPARGRAREIFFRLAVNNRKNTGTRWCRSGEIL